MGAVQRPHVRLKETDDAYPRVVVIDGKNRIIEVAIASSGSSSGATGLDGDRPASAAGASRWSGSAVAGVTHALGVIRALPEGIEEEVA